jgi:rhodanese-related sulfurtransferase
MLVTHGVEEAVARIVPRWSQIVCESLATRTRSLVGGFGAWQGAGLPVQRPQVEYLRLDRSN